MPPCVIADEKPIDSCASEMKERDAAALSLLQENGCSEAQEVDPDDVELCSNAETTRIGRWKNQLLDLSLRNTLLNSGARASSGLLRFFVHDLAAFEDALSGEARQFEICSSEEVDGGVPAEHFLGVERAQEELARMVFAHGRLLAQPPPSRGNDSPADRIQDRLVKIARASKTAIAETGTNTLFIALGFLRWRCEKRKDEPLLAPLVLIPAKLERARAGTRFVLSALDEDVRLNLTLVEMLRQEFGIELPTLDSALPEDESGVDLSEVFRLFREAIRGMDGFSVEETSVLGNFSFAKHLMWRDLEERAEVLARSRIVRHLLDETRAPFSEKAAFPRPERLDIDIPAGTFFCPLPADSSQLAAVFAAASGKNFILVGPPGTGKSQTIANLIAHALAVGKTVLFVAEKSAALNVVFRRLKKVGLGDFCLELHSNKTNKRETYAQFSIALDLAAVGEEGDLEQERAEVITEVQSLRDTLLRLPNILHRRRSNGISLADAVGVICCHEDVPAIELLWENPLADTENIRERKLSVAEELGASFSETRGALSRAAGTISAGLWSQGWQRAGEAAVRNLAEAAKNLGLKISDFTAETGLLPIGGTLKSFSELLKLVGALLAVRGENAELVIGKNAEKDLETLRAAAMLAENCSRHKRLLSLEYSDELAETFPLNDLLKTWREAEISWGLSRWIKRRKVIRALRVLAGGTKKPPFDPRVDLGNLIAIQACKKEFSEKYVAFCSAYPSLINGLTPSGAVPRIDALNKARLLVVRALSRLGDVPEKREAWETVIARWLSGKDAAFARGGNIEKVFNAASTALAILSEKRTEHTTATGAVLSEKAAETAESVAAFAEEMLADRESWRDVCAWNYAAVAAERRGMAALAAAVRAEEISAKDVCSVFEVNYCRRWAEAVFDSEPELLDYTTGKNLARLEKYRAADDASRVSSAKTVRARLIERSRDVFDRECAGELSLLRHEIGKRRANLPLRRFFAKAPHIQRLLKPCLLTSPLSAAQYLDADAEPFDLVVFDEASQISVWDAVGALARGKSAVVVGDPNQLPPTNFFRRANAGNGCESSEPDSGEAIVPVEAESVLDECRACGVPAMNLSWHYRSRAESLIAFSNERYYAGALATFPSPKLQDRSLESVFCENAVYGEGAARTNPVEAEALVARVIEDFLRPDFFYGEFTSVGIVTFNIQQQALICRLLEEAQEKHPKIRKYFSEEEVSEPVFVKNLENVQGDERGVIYFSTTFGPNACGNVSQNFGPINREGGERRLNVAITRSRAAMRVFTSLRPVDIRTERGGMADLRDFLEFARTGKLASGNDKRSPLREERARRGSGEAAIAAGLEARGWKCVRNVGFSGVRVDIAVVHPDRADEFLAGILCDGVDSLRVPTVRDREILREEVLRGLGWNLIRAWMLDRWLTPELCVSRVDSRLQNFLEKTRQFSETGPSIEN